MNCCRETVKMGLPPGNRPAVTRDWTRGVPERYVAECDTRGRPEGRQNPRSQQVIHETSELGQTLLNFAPNLTSPLHFVNANVFCAYTCNRVVQLALMDTLRTDVDSQIPG
jgi:hypothetical protein